MKTVECTKDKTVLSFRKMHQRVNGVVCGLEGDTYFLDWKSVFFLLVFFWLVYLFSQTNLVCFLFLYVGKHKLLKLAVGMKDATAVRKDGKFYMTQLEH